MKRCLVTVSTGRFQELEPLVLPGFKAYADGCQADVVVIRDDLGAGNPQWNKLQIVRALDQADRIVFVDLDCVIKPGTPDLWEFVPAGTFGMLDEGAFCTPRELQVRRDFADDLASKLGMTPPSWAGNSYYNTGVMVFGHEHRYLFDQPHAMPHAEMADQSWVNLQIAWRDVPIRSLDRRWNMYLFNPPDNWHETGYIMHAAGGIPIEEKRRQVQQFLDMLAVSVPPTGSERSAVGE